MRPAAVAMQLLGVVTVLAGVVLALAAVIGVAGEIVLYAAGLGLLGGGAVARQRAAAADHAGFTETDAEPPPGIS